MDTIHWIKEEVGFWQAPGESYALIAATLYI